MASDWAVVREYAGQVQAEFDQATLREAGIPAVIRGAFVGAFGPGFAGGSPFGIKLLVPRQDVEHARDLLGIEGEGTEPA